MATLKSEMELQASVGNSLKITAGHAPPKSADLALKLQVLQYKVMFIHLQKLKNTHNYFYYNYYTVIIA